MAADGERIIHEGQPDPDPLREYEFHPQCDFMRISTRERCGNNAIYVLRMPHVVTHRGPEIVLCCESCLADLKRQRFPFKCPSCSTVFGHIGEYIASTNIIPTMTNEEG